MTLIQTLGKSVRAVLGWFSPFFRRLQWKLTLAYTLFTLSTTVILSGVAIGIFWYLNFWSGFYPSEMAKYLHQGAAPASMFLEATPIDQTGLQAWLDAAIQNDYLVLNVNDEYPLFPERTRPVPATLGWVKLIAVTDARGNTLAQSTQSTPITNDDDEQKFLGLEAEVNRILTLALQRKSDLTGLTFRNDSHLLVIVPILGSKEQGVGTLIFITDTFPLSQETLLKIVMRRLILPFSGIMLGVGIVIGLLFGYLLARGLTHRLHALDQITDAWSEGNFEVLSDDKSGDELGHLARHMNDMAMQLQNLFQTQHELTTLEERNRLARDLHDSVKQQIFATTMQVGAAKALLDQTPQSAKKHLAEAETLVNQAQQELTALIFQLRPAALEGRGLAKALREYVSDWSRQTNISMDIRVRGEQPLPLPIEQTLFRVAQESLANIARHSRAKQAEVDLAWENGLVSLTVTDNGQGFKPLEKKGRHGVGLQSMRERVKTLGGHLRIESRPNQGTTITVELEVEHA